MHLRPATLLLCAVLGGPLLLQTAEAQQWLARGAPRERILPPRAAPAMPVPRMAAPAAPTEADRNGWAQQRRERRTESTPQRSRLSPADAARRAQQMNGGGRILAVDQTDQGYRVKLLKDGEVRVISVPDY